MATYVSTYTTAMSAARYSGVRHNLWRWFLLLVFGSWITVMYIFIMPRCSRAAAGARNTRRAAPRCTPTHRAADVASPPRPSPPPPHYCSMITLRSGEALSGMGLSIVRYLVHPVIWAALQMNFRTVLRHLGARAQQRRHLCRSAHGQGSTCLQRAPCS